MKRRAHACQQNAGGEGESARSERQCPRALLDGRIGVCVMLRSALVRATQNNVRTNNTMLEAIIREREMFSRMLECVSGVCVCFFCVSLGVFSVPVSSVSARH